MLHKCYLSSSSLFGWLEERTTACKLCIFSFIKKKEEEERKRKRNEKKRNKNFRNRNKAFLSDSKCFFIIIICEFSSSALNLHSFTWRKLPIQKVKFLPCLCFYFMFSFWFGMAIYILSMDYVLTYLRKEFSYSYPCPLTPQDLEPWTIRNKNSVHHSALYFKALIRLLLQLQKHFKTLYFSFSYYILNYKYFL